MNRNFIVIFIYPSNKATKAMLFLFFTFLFHHCSNLIEKRCLWFATCVWRRLPTVISHIEIGLDWWIFLGYRWFNSFLRKIFLRKNSLPSTSNIFALSFGYFLHIARRILPLSGFKGRLKIGSLREGLLNIGIFRRFFQRIICIFLCFTNRITWIFVGRDAITGTFRFFEPSLFIFIIFYFIVLIVSIFLFFFMT